MRGLALTVNNFFIKSDADQAGDSHQHVDDAADDGALPAENGGNQVKLKGADEQPVEGPDNHQRKRSNKHNKTSFHKKSNIRIVCFFMRKYIRFVVKYQ